LLYPDNVLKSPNEISVGDTIKTINFDWIPEEPGTIDNPSYQVNVNSGSFNTDLTTFTIDSTEIVGLSDITRTTIMIRVTLENGITYEDLPTSVIYIEEYDTLRTTFSDTNTFRVNDSIVFYDYNNETLVKSKIINLEIVYVNRKVYDVNVEPNDVFLSLADSTLGLLFVQHNECPAFCFVPEDCGNWQCANCPGCGPVGFKL
jgi:hypothetical protein